MSAQTSPGAASSGTGSSGQTSSGTASPGKFIAFEGGEGVGKSTQAQLLAQALGERGIEVCQTREPGGTPEAEAIRTLLLHPPGKGWSARSEALLFAAARSNHVEALIRPAIKRGAWVICDRFVDSSRAYQGRAGGLGDEAILRLHAFGSAGLRPDLTIVLEADPALVAHRLRARDAGDSDAIGARSASYHAAVAQAFRSFAQADPTGFAVINADQDAERVHMQVLESLACLLDER